MPRLEVELTSARPDGSWTWRKAGARQPKGEMAGTLLPADAQVGDVLKVEADVLIDGIEVTEVIPTKTSKTDRFERIELAARPDPEQFVSTQLAPKGRGDRGDRGDRPRRDRDSGGPGRDGRGREGRGAKDGDKRGPRTGSRDDDQRGPRSDSGARRPRPPAFELPERPKPKRIRPGRAHRTVALESLPPEQRPIAEQALQGGVPAVRAAIEAQNVSNKAQGLPEVTGDELVQMAERLLPLLKTAEWRDRADAAMSILDQVDLRDLRSLVVAADGVTRDDVVTEMKTTLTAAYTRRAEEEQTSWLEELKLLLDAERVVRALRVSSRPPKAGVPLPKELADRLIAAASASIAADTFTDRWDTVLDALSFSPVRAAVRATSIPETVSDELKKIIEAFSDRLPQIAEQFGIDPATVPKKAKRRPGQDRRTRGAAPKGASAAPRPDKPVPPPPPVQPAPAPEPVVDTSAEQVEEPAGVVEDQAEV